MYPYNCRVLSSSCTFNCSATKALPSDGDGCPDSRISHVKYGEKKILLRFINIPAASTDLKRI